MRTLRRSFGFSPAGAGRRRRLRDRLSPGLGMKQTPRQDHRGRSCVPAYAALAGALLLLAAGPAARADLQQEEKVREARWVYESLLGGENEAVPRELLIKTRCIVIFPGVVEAAFAVGGSHGVGVASCRNNRGNWSPPAFMRLTGGSLGLQVGVRKSDLVLFIVTARGAKSMLDPTFAFGGEVQVAAGPRAKEKAISTDARFEADMYFYSHQESGLFAGAAIEGSHLRVSRKAIRRYYGRDLWAESILFDHEVPQHPPEARAFMDGLKMIPTP